MRKIYLLIMVLFCVNVLFAQCFDMTNLNSPNLTCTYGDFYDPYYRVGIVDYGSDNIYSRHTINNDVYATDPNVSALSTIPQGETSSIRLGNWDTGAEAESMTFTYVVDAESPILLLKYAAVMENPGHDSNEQPRLTLQVYDRNHTLVNPECMSFDFISSVDLGWNSLNSGELLWKDWTFIGVDLSSYIGQTLKIQLTNYDCEQSGHYGYSYFHLSCKQKKIKSLICGDADHTTFSAPAGFEYNWYYFNGSEKVQVGINQTVNVPIDSKEYFCDIHQVGNSDCSFTLSAIANPRYPIADFSVRQISKCVDTLYLTNLSAVSVDGLVKNKPHEDCDEVIWDLGDGRQLTDYDISGLPITYATAGTYTITLTAKLIDGNCIDTYSRTVTVRGYDDVYEGEIAASICDGDYYIFGEQKLTKEGVYYKTTINRLGCDSITKLFLTVRESYLKEDTVYFCENDVYYFHGEEISQKGIYYARYTAQNGCDSVYKLVAYTMSAPLVKDTIYICENDSVYLNGRFVKEKGVYLDTLRTFLGCDSICQTIVQYRPTFLIEDEAVICQNEIYFYHGTNYNTPGVYYHNYTSQYGCDSIYKLTLKVYPSYLIPTYAEICHDQTFNFRGRELNAPGIYYDSLYTHFGCDSVYKLILNKLPIYLIEDTVNICEGDIYNFRGRYVSEPGFHYDSLKTINGCDSVYKLLLVVTPRFYHEYDTTICGNEYYNFRGRLLNKTGVYYDSIKTEYGCDSIYRLNLHVNNTYLYDSYVEVCDGDVFSFRGKEIYESGVYYDSLYTQNGCDSIYKLTFNKAPSYLFELKDSVCANKFYNFRGRKLNKPGIYFDSLKTVSGCDSVYRLELIVKPTYLFKTKASICDNDSIFAYRNIDFNQSGLYYDSLTTNCGCDSVYMLDLTVNNSYLLEEIISICDYEKYYFRGNLYTESGIYWDSLVTSSGCDSIYKLDLRVTPTYRDTIFDTICLGEEYNFRGQILSEEGCYVDTAYNPVSDSCEVVYLFLKTKLSTVITDVTTNDVCADDLIYEIIYKYYGTKPISYSLYYSDEARAIGFKNVIDHPFSDTIFDTIPQINMDYIRPDYYNVRLELNNGICDPAINGYDFKLLVRYPSWIMEQNWNDVVAILNENYNGGYRFDKYEWYVNDRLLDVYTGSNLYLHDIHCGDEVEVHLTREGESYSIPTCSIIIEDRSELEQTEYPVLVNTTSLSKQNSRMAIKAHDDGYYVLYDLYGQLILQGVYSEGDNFELEIPNISGCYILYLNTKTHGSKYEKIIRK